jgi:hypothetical protein
MGELQAGAFVEGEFRIAFTGASFNAAGVPR